MAIHGWKLWLSVMVAVVLVAGTAWVTQSRWRPAVQRQVTELRNGSSNGSKSTDDHGHDHHGHDHANHSEETSIELSPNGLKNIGYRPMTVELGTYTKYLDFPGMVMEWPGRTRIQISAPMTGIVTAIHTVQGAAVPEDAPLFDIRLTHEELVTAQSNLIRTAENLEVVEREIQRLRSLDEGIVAGKRVLEQEYEKQKLEASLKAERQALLLHGLNEEQVQSIVKDRKLFQTLTVHAPEHSHEGEACLQDHLFHVQNIPVHVGQQVQAGEVLGVLADHCELHIEGRAFADDAAVLREAVRQGWEVEASLLVGDRETDRIQGLKLLYLSDQVDPQSRALRFYLSLPNEVVLDQTSPAGHQYIEWRFKPGQRVELRIPVEHWKDRIVLPVEAIVEEAAESYVYQQNGDHFDRVPVHVEYRDRRSVVIANDGSLFPGDVVAARGAYQMHLALKNRSGGGVDPHAGHQH